MVRQRLAKGLARQRLCSLALAEVEVARFNSLGSGPLKALLELVLQVSNQYKYQRKAKAAVKLKSQRLFLLYAGRRSRGRRRSSAVTRPPSVVCPTCRFSISSAS